MNSIVRVLFCFLLLSLSSSCALQKQTMLHSNEEKLCQNTCLQRAQSCQKLCLNNCLSCKDSSMGEAINDYAHYIHEEQLKGGSVNRVLNSYRDPLQCRKVSCDCTADLMTCDQNCTGVIYKNLRTVPSCT